MLFPQSQVTYPHVLTTDFYSNLDYQSTNPDFTSWSSGSTVFCVFFGGGSCRVYTKSYDSKYYSTSHASLLRETPTHPFTQPSWISHTTHNPFPTNSSSFGRSGPADIPGPGEHYIMRASLPSWAAGKSKHTCWTRPKAPACFRVTEHRSAGGRTELLAKTLNSLLNSGIRSYWGQLSQGCFEFKYWWFPTWMLSKFYHTVRVSNLFSTQRILFTHF